MAKKKMYCAISNGHYPSARFIVLIDLYVIRKVYAPAFFGNLRHIYGEFGTAG